MKLSRSSSLEDRPGAADSSVSTAERYARTAARRNAGIALIAAILFVVLVLSRSGWNPLRFPHIGSYFDIGVEGSTDGYDGQFFYFIARDWTDAVPHIDGPTLRYMRIFYPLTARVLALGQSALVPWTLILVNVLAFSAGTGLITLLIARRGGPPGYGLLYAAWIGSLLVLRFDLSELLCFALAMAAVVAYERREIGWTVLLLVLAALTKELALVFAAGLAFHAVTAERRWRDALLIGLIPLAAFVGWLLVMRAWLGQFPFGYPAARFHFPFYGLMTVEDPASRAMMAIWLGLPAAVLTGLALWQIFRSRQLSLSAALLLAGAGFVMVMPHVSWEDPMAATRVGMPLIIGGLLFLAEHRPRLLKFAAALWLPALLILAITPGMLGF